MAEQDTGTAQATAQDDISGQAAVTGGDAGTQNQETDQDKVFNQKVWSAAGRLYESKVAKDRVKMREEILAELKPMFQSIHMPPAVNQDDAYKKFGESVQEQFFGGDPVGAIDKVLKLKEQAKQNLTQTQNMTLMRGITTYSDQPYYEDIHPAMQKLAKEKVAEGWPADAALRASYAEAKASFLEDKMKGGDRETSGLGLSGGGRRTERAQTAVELTPAEKTACARDIRDGYYKNKEDWVKARSHKISEARG